jgi:hypothetical protein
MTAARPGRGTAAAACLVVALSGLPAGAAEREPAPPPEPADAPLTWSQVGRDARYLYTRPAHLDRKGWSKVAWTIGIGASLYLVRDEVREWAQERRSESRDDLLQAIRNMGKGASVPIVALGFYLSGTATGSARQRETAVALLETVTHALTIAGAGSYVLATERPDEGDDIRFFETGGHGVSGDTTIAASLLAPIIDRHLQIDPDDGRPVRFWKRFGAWGLYGAAGLVAYQRINQDKHYLPDVYFGYAAGLTAGRLVVDARKGGRGWRDEARRVRITTAPGGLRIVW